MTATIVNGTPVLADQPASSPLTSVDGRPIQFTQIRQLLLADGSTTYGCAHCDYTSPRIGSVRPHLKAHKPKAAKGAGLPELSLTELVDRVAKLGEITKDRDHWKARALDAERDLKAIRKALGAIS